MTTRLLLTQPRLIAFDNRSSREEILRCIDTLPDAPRKEDILILPEHAFFHHEAEAYLDEITSLAAHCGCTVLGGSFHEYAGDVRRNTGAVVTASGEVLMWYDKLRPYAEERSRVDAGVRLGECSINGVRVLVLICADFWFSDLFHQARALPDVVLVPALSVTRKATPDYSRTLWRHLAVSRAYEFGVYVGISDWSADAQLPALRTSGVGGFADPTTTDSDGFYSATGDARMQVVTLDLDALAAFREDRRARGFYWDRSLPQE